MVYAKRVVLFSMIIAATVRAAPVLQGRALWGFGNSRHKNALILAVLGWSISGMICMTTGGTGCLASLALTAVFGAIATAPSRPGTCRTNDSPVKRDGVSWIDAYRQGLYEPGEVASVELAPNVTLSLEPATDLHLTKRDTMASVGITLLAIGNMTIMDGSDQIKPVLLGESDFGNHMIVTHHFDDHAQLIDAVVRSVDEAPALEKRSLEVTWASYTYNDIDMEYAKGWLDSEHDLGPRRDLSQGMNDFMAGQATSYKYCAAAQLGDGGKAAYDDIGKNNIMKGEIYFNQVGGIDNPCLDAKDGVDDLDNPHW